MAGSDPIQQLLFAAGQNQSQRQPAALAPGFVEVDEQSAADLLRFMRRLAPLIHFYDTGNADTTTADWSGFFPFSEAEIGDWLQTEDGNCPPHLALMRSFLRLYREPQALVNQLTGKHLDFFYRDVLHLQPSGAVGDRAHLILQLKARTPALLVTPSHRFAAGKDATGVERLYRPLQDTVINQGRVVALRSLYHDATGNGVIRFAPIANSSDGLGAELDDSDPKWPAFGHAGLPAAETGFAIASPVLRLQEGVRRIRLTLAVTPSAAASLGAGHLSNAFDLYISGASQWLGPFTVSPTFSNNKLQFEYSLGKEQEAVVDYDPGIHGYDYDARAPLLQLLLRSENSATGYRVFENIRLDSARIDVEVSDIVGIGLRNDLGALDAGKAFMPFGPQPKKGGRLLLDAGEALNKKLTELTLAIRWQDAPGNLASHYSGYSVAVSNSTFTVGVSFADAGGWHTSTTGQALFASSDASAEHSLSFATSPGGGSSATSKAQFASALNFASGQWAKESLYSLLLANPVYSARATLPPGAGDGLITLTLEHDFLHQTYRKDYVKSVLEFAKGSDTSLSLINEPYTPTIQHLSLAYRAHSDSVAISSVSAGDFANSDIQFYHLGYFGQMREHGYQRSQFDFLTDKSVSLLPRYNSGGELLVGIDGIGAGDNVSLLLQVAEGSADPDLPRQPVTWSVLCDNYWKPLGQEQLTHDSSNQLLTSGIVAAAIPREATTSNSILPSGPVWLKAAVTGEVAAVPQLLDVVANALAVEFVDQGNDPRHLAAPLPAGSIGKLKTVEVGVKLVAQPYASFGGQLAEQSDAFNTRVAERLRHKDRALSGWDFERIALQQFPSLHKVKCINHARPGNWLAPGQVMLVVIPRLDNQNALDPLQPRVDSNTLASIRAHLQKRTGMQVQLHVRNPRYRQVQLSLKVRFRAGLGFNFYRQQLQADLRKALSPWAYSDAEDIEFGGTLYKSVLIDFIDELAYVDFVTEVKLYDFIDGADNLVDRMQVQPRAPDEILVSAASHAIHEYA